MKHRRYVVVAGLALLLAPRAEAAQPAASAEVVASHRATLPSAPDDPAWRTVPVFTAALLLQDMVEPRLLEPGTDKVNVRAITDGTQIAFRLNWADNTKDDLPGIARYSDACAVQLPVSTTPDVPAPQMGEAGRPVEITYWRAFWQGAVDGRENSIKALYPGATVDHYPFETASLAPGSEDQQAMAKRYAPARALGNAMAGPRQRPVEDLVAEGPAPCGPRRSHSPTAGAYGAITGGRWCFRVPSRRGSNQARGRRLRSRCGRGRTSSRGHARCGPSGFPYWSRKQNEQWAGDEMSTERPRAMSRIAHAAEWRLLGLLFERPHDAWRGEVANVAQEVADAAMSAAAAAAQGATEGHYLAMLGPGGAVSPREVTYRSFEDPGRFIGLL